MNSLRIMSAFAAGFFAISALTAAETATENNQPAEAATENSQEAEAAKPAAVESAAPAKTTAKTSQAAEDPASTVNEKEQLPAKPKKQPPTYKSSKLVPYIIITANYETSVFLAETARKKAKCPIIIVPEAMPFPEKGTLLTVKMPDNSAISLRAEDLSRFLAYLRPRNVIILGNTDVVPPIYSLAVPRGSRTYHVDERAWKVNAVRLDDHLNTAPAIYDAYRKFNKERVLQAEKLKEEKAAKEAAEAAKTAGDAAQPDTETH